MKRRTATLAGIGLALAACSTTPAQADDRAQYLVDQLYGPFAQSEVPFGPDWDTLPASTGLAFLIDRWNIAREEVELTDLSSFGWLCECQDWDDQKFAYELVARREGELLVTVNLGWEERDKLTRLVVVETAQGLRVEDLFNESFPNGLQAALRAEIEELEG